MAEEKKTVKSSEKKEPAKKAPAKKAAAPKAEEAPKAEKKVEAKKEAPKKEAPKKEAKKAEKKEEPAKPKATEARAFARDVRITPRKVRLVADLVRGKSVKDALGILAGCNRVAKSPVEKAIRSASANAVNNFGMDQNALYVAEIQVGDGLKMKRYIPRAKGSASSIVKRTAHISVVVKEKK